MIPRTIIHDRELGSLVKKQPSRRQGEVWRGCRDKVQVPIVHSRLSISPSSSEHGPTAACDNWPSSYVSALIGWDTLIAPFPLFSLGSNPLGLIVHYSARRVVLRTWRTRTSNVLLKDADITSPTDNHGLRLRCGVLKPVCKNLDKKYTTDITRGDSRETAICFRNLATRLPFTKHQWM